MPRSHLRGDFLQAIGRIILFAFILNAKADEICNGHLAVRMDRGGAYQVTAKTPGWTLAGTLPGPIQKLTTDHGADAIGSYQEIAFPWQDGDSSLTGTIRLYDHKDIILFLDTLAKATLKPPSPFPNFTQVPAELFSLSYRDVNFSVPQFNNLRTVSSPWLFFDNKDHAILLSAASHFLIGNLMGDGRQQIASGFNPALANLPAGFTQETILVMSTGINNTYDTWGRALTDLQGKNRPAYDADPILKYYGYWTDNGADYYYNYDLKLGYADTLKALVKAYREEQIPLRYLQLDSWWYHKNQTGLDGKTGSAKNPRLPEGDWNYSGGLLEYKPSPFLFPQGLAAFQQEIHLPLITHNRWIDPASAYHDRFKISGLAAVDPHFWDEIASYMKASGIVAYEQDWLNEIFHRSPELTSTTDRGDAFLDNMARATKEEGQTMQYCMALPRCFLQGSKYDNLTTIRTGDDRFCPDRYRAYLFVNRLASALGIWPWSDVFKSGETNNMLLCNLSAGPVGTGDALGKENKENIFRTIRADGVIIKPDVPLVPNDSAYLDEAQKKKAPLVATTYTDHNGLKTIYAIAFSKSPGTGFSIEPADLGLSGPAYAYDYFAGTGQQQQATDPLTGAVHPSGVSFYIIAPVGKSGIAFLGDKDKFVSTGKQRIASLEDQPGSLSVEVLLAPSEEEVTLHGYADTAPSVDVTSGQAGPMQYDPATKHFTVTVKPDSKAVLDTQADPVRHLTVLFKEAHS